jgi:hypothetical protein
MALKPQDKNFGSNNKNINYVGKDFASLKQTLIDYTKTYFPNTYSDFSDASPGTIFIEQAAAIGDILSFYQDTQLKESIISHATERKNVMALAQNMGYKPKVTSPAVTTITVYQLVPAIGGNSTNNAPDSKYYLKIKDGMEIESTTNPNVVFRTTDVVDFANSTGRDIEVYERDATTGEPTRYLITKKVKAISAKEISTSISFTDDTDYPIGTLTDTNIIGIISVIDSSGNTYYEVPYLAQESIFVEQPNTDFNSDLSNESNVVPYILEVQKVPYRFSVKVNSDNTIDLQFGSGDVRMNDETILPNTKNIGLGLANSIQRLNQGIDPSNFLKTNTFGIAPINTTLTIKYLTGGGVASNINQGDLTTIRRVEFEEDLISFNMFDINVYNDTKSTIAVENLEPATGGRGGESIEEIRQNALATFGSQNRAVTRQDYIVRALSMPERYGSVAKVYVSPDSEVDTNSPASILSNPKNITEFTTEFVGVVEGLKDKSKTEIQNELTNYLRKKKTSLTIDNNPFAINMYVLGYDVNKNLSNLNTAIKQNLKTYLGEYRMLTDGVNIIDGFVINIGCDFEVICYSNYNKREVLANCLLALQNYFNIDNWTFNKPINISEIELILANIEGVMSVPSVKISNLCCTDNYSNHSYNIEQATKGKIVYPSLDPCVFEVKYPNKDIKGRAI